MSGAAARALRPMRTALPRAPARMELPRAAALTMMLAVAAHLLVSSNLLFVMGIDYAAPGGFKLLKFHPATYLIFAALGLYCARGSRPAARLKELLLRQMATLWMLGVFSLIIGYYIFSLGPSGVSIYVENFISAGLLSLLAAQAAPAQLRAMGWMMIGLIALSAPLAITETIAHWHLVPIYLGDEHFIESVQDWRGSALYDHPLTGATLTAMGVWLVLASPMRDLGKLALLGLFMVALVSFGGRTSLAVTLLVLLALAGLVVGRGLLARNLSARMGGLVLLGLVAVPLCLWLLVAQTSIGGRIAQHLYADDNSASVRLDIWTIPSYMTLREALFGTTAERQEQLLAQIGYIYPQTDIENFWLLSFINLGGFGFAVYMAGFLPFLGFLFRISGRYGRVVLLTTLVTASSSNSLARKSNILFLLVAAIFAIRGFDLYPREAGRRGGG
jgi:hypothetical protein